MLLSVASPVGVVFVEITILNVLKIFFLKYYNYFWRAQNGVMIETATV
jgi:hypothetical protein